VSGAAGATGSVAGQLASHWGCRVIGIAGGPEKCAWLTDELGFDAAIDYKGEDVSKRLRELCPKGLDVFFDNVGGEILEAALANLAMHARVVLCGAISNYNAEAPAGPRNYMNLLVRRSRMEGFVVFDYFPRMDEAMAELVALVVAALLLPAAAQATPPTLDSVTEAGGVLTAGWTLPDGMLPDVVEVGVSPKVFPQGDFVRSVVYENPSTLTSWTSSQAFPP